MSKPTINKAIRLQGKSYGPGQEAELQSVMTSAQHDDWQERGLIEGDWEVSAASEGGSTPSGDKLDQFAAECEKITAEHQQRVAALQSALDEAVAENERLQKQLETEAGSTPSDPFALAKAIGVEAVGSLLKAGYDSQEKIAAASDKELEDLPHIGEATIKKLRSMAK